MQQTEQSMLLALREHFPAREYALLPQVRNGTGFSRAARTADAIAVSLWPSRGIYLHGIEIKVNRYDWVRELKSPEKADDIAGYCHFWWVAIPEREIVADELPFDWGLLILGDGKLKRAVQAPKRDPKPLTLDFVAALLRKADSEAPLFTEVDALVKKRAESMRPEIEKAVRSEHGRELDDYNKLKSSVAAFEDASGIHIDRYSDYYSRDIGTAVKLFRGIKYSSALEELERAENILRRTLEAFSEQRKALEQIRDSG